MENKKKFIPDQNSNLMDQVRETLRYYHYACRTEQTYCMWIKQYLSFYGMSRHPGSVEDRIAGAENHATYLCASVEVIAKAKVANLTSHGLEQLIHAVFAKARLDIEITDAEGQIKKATEWFSAPRDTIEHALQLIAINQISVYEYDPDSGTLLFRK